MKAKRPIKIVLRGKPKSTQHIYGMHGKIRYMKKDAKELKEEYIQQIEEQYDGPVLTEDLHAFVSIFHPTKRKVDRDNFNKLRQDSMEGIVVEDDSQIQGGVLFKYYDKEDPRVEVTLYKVGNF